MRQRHVIGNWKQHGSLAGNRALITAICAGAARKPAARLGVAVPAAYLAQAAQLLGDSGIVFGAQNVAASLSGAYTGEIGAAMVADLGATFTLIGHSERRSLFGESDEVVANKLRQAVAAGVQPIVCVGETLAERDSGVTLEVVARQVQAALGAGFGASGGVIAYEPVWAIGTGRSAGPAEAQQVHAAIRRQLLQAGGEMLAATPLLYGGSVKADNAGAIFAMPDIDGGLIGGASLKAEEFLAIWHALP